MNSVFTALICIVFAASAAGAFDADPASGMIEKQGYNYGAAVYENIADFSGDNIYTGDLHSSSARINPEIPSQIILSGLSAALAGDITEDNIMVITSVSHWIPHKRTGYEDRTYYAFIVDQADGAIPT